MLRWKASIFGLCLLIGIFTSRIILNTQTLKPAILADVTNSATVITPTTTPTSAPTFTTPTPVHSPALSPTLSPVLSPTPFTTPSPTIIIAPTPETKKPEQYFRYSLYGYTSSYANVKLEGIRLLEGTKANKDGYFEFINFASSSQNKEFCLISIDTENLISMPLCVPVPNHLSQITYGPYLLPPTLKLKTNDLKTKQKTIVSGKTIPNTKANVYIFTEPERKPVFSLAKPVFAQSNPKPKVIKIDAETDGSFSTSVYANAPGKKRIFAQSVFSLNNTNNQTPKSFTLTLNILTLFISYLIGILSFVRSLFTLNAVILLQIIILIAVLFKKSRVYDWYALSKNKQTALVLYKQQSIVRSIKNYTPITQTG